MKKTNEVSKLVGVSRRTLQYYDDEGMLLVERTENNYRLYDEKALEKIWRVMLYKEMGFKLKEIKQLLPLTDNEQEEYLGLRVEKVNSQIKGLEEQKEFISLVLKYGMPQIPDEGKGMTYASSIKELKRQMKEKEG